MKQVWNEIKFWIEANAPHLLTYLAPGATIEDIQDVERKLNIRFCEDFKEFYMIHNGQTDETECLIYEQNILSLKRIVHEWQVWTHLLDLGELDDYDENLLISDPDPGIKNDWWNTKWVPITSNGCGDNFCIDMDPDFGGHAGQIISMWHDAGWRELKGNSFQEWLVQYAKDLRKGKYVYKNGIGIKMKKYN